MPLAHLYAGEVLALLRRHGTANAHLEQLRVAADGVERRPELVAHHGQEFALGAVCRLGRLEARTQRIVGHPALGDVLDDADEAHGVSRLALKVDLPRSAKPAKPPRRHRAMLHLVRSRGVGVERRGDLRLDRRAVVGVDLRRHHCPDEDLLLRRQAEHCAEVRIDREPVGGDIPIEHAEPGGRDRLLQPQLALAQSRLGSSVLDGCPGALRHLLDERDLVGRPFTWRDGLHCQQRDPFALLQERHADVSAEAGAGEHGHFGWRDRRIGVDVIADRRPPGAVRVEQARAPALACEVEGADHRRHPVRVAVMDHHRVAGRFAVMRAVDVEVFAEHARSFCLHLHGAGEWAQRVGEPDQEGVAHRGSRESGLGPLPLGDVVEDRRHQRTSIVADA